MHQFSLLPLIGLLAQCTTLLAATVNFELDVTWGNSTAVGTSKTQFLLNGQSPGPALTCNVGDTVEFLVNNCSPYNITVHFHGITQLGTPWSDGVPGVSQEPILPGGTFLYTWTADEYGTYWYHSHYKGQVMDGFYGPISIQPSAAEPRPFSLISNSSSDVAAMMAAEKKPNLLILSDWILETFDALVAAEQASGYDITCPDTLVVNGKGSVQCPGEAYINSFVSPQLGHLLNGTNLTAKGCVPPLPPLEGPFPHTPSALPPSAYDVCTPTQGEVEIISVDAASGWASVNLISAAGIDTTQFSIDNHVLYVYAADGRYIVPQMVNTVSVPNGNRYAAMVKLNQTPGNYTFRVASVANNQYAMTTGIFSYKNAGTNITSTPWVNYAGSNLTASVIPFSDQLVVPFDPIVPGEPGATYILDLGQLGASYLWSLSGPESYSPSDALITPLLFQPDQPLGNDGNITIKTVNGTWVDLVLVVPGPLGPAHPIHKHSNKALVIGQGIGNWTWPTVAAAQAALPHNFNLVNPPVRDGFTTIPATGNGTWTVIRYEVINPGAFIIHCHIQTHLTGGMAMVLEDGVAEFPKVPQTYLSAGSNTNATCSSGDKHPNGTNYGNSSTTSSSGAATVTPTKPTSAATFTPAPGAASLNRPAALLTAAFALIAYLYI